MALPSHKAGNATGKGLCGASHCPAAALCKKSPSLLRREGEGLAGLSICMLQTMSKGLDTQFPGHLSKEGPSKLLFLTP